MSTVSTVGHSNHSLERFLDVLQRNHVTAIADVRSFPFSRHNPHFNQQPLRAALKQAGVAYAFLGKELGARSDDSRHYSLGRVVYSRLADSSLFQSGINRVLAGMKTHRLALMCAERDPITCHRTILVARDLIRRGIEVEHILSDGSVELHDQSLDRLMRELRIDTHDLFATRTQLCDRAYREQEKRIAYVKHEVVAAE